MAALVYLAVVVAITISTSQADQLEDELSFGERAVPEDSSLFSDQDPKVMQVRDMDGQEAGTALELDPAKSRTLRQTLSSIISLPQSGPSSTYSRLSSLSRLLNTAIQEITSIQTYMRQARTRLGASVNVRLMGSYTSSQGRVEISVNGGAWGTVCDDGWDNSDATVVCRMLGFRSGTARTNAFFGQGTGEILLDDVDCSGVERNIVQCRLPQFGYHNCNHGEDAGVVCA